MAHSRREFLRTGAIAGALGLGLGPAGLEAAGLGPAGSRAGGTGPTGSPLDTAPPARRLDLLILGGTSFIGPHQVQYALGRGHNVTLFNRGQTNPGLFPEAEKLIGDRVGNLEALRGRRWDAVIDNSATDPAWVRDTAQLLRDSVDQYLFVSTRSVYRDLSAVPMTAAGPVFTPENTPVAAGQPLPYGLSKSMAEQEAHRALPGRTTIVRPGLIIGPGDDTDRFTYWPVRIARGGEVLAPGDGTDPVQVIDARDLGEWIIHLVEARTYGVFNGVGPRRRTFAELLYGIHAVTDSDIDWTWVPASFLAEHRVRPYAEMPVWRPAEGIWRGFAQFDLTPEIASGLRFRPLAVTAHDTLEFHRSRPAERQAALRAGISADREREVLALWRAARRAG
jgi:2'-hydroxyisoflavone reductase